MHLRKPSWCRLATVTGAQKPGSFQKENDMAGWKVHTVEEEHHLKSSEYDLWPKDLPKKGGDIFTILDDEVLFS